MSKKLFLLLISLLLATSVLPVSSWTTAQLISKQTGHESYLDWGPKIAVDVAGNSYVTWVGGDVMNLEIYWVKVDAAGVAGTVQKVSTHPDNLIWEDGPPQIAVDASGNSYITWYGFDGTDYEIYWVKVDAAGVAGTVQKVSTHPDNITNEDYNPKIAVDVAGNSYVTWSGRNGNNKIQIYWVKINAASVPGTVQKVSTHPDSTYGCGMWPQIAVDATGNSYVTFSGSDGNDSEIYWVKVDAAGVPGTVQKVSTHPDNIANADGDPQIAVDFSGSSHVTWYGDDGNDSEIYWVKVDAAGVPGTVKKVSTHPDNMPWDDEGPQIAVDFSGNSHVIWKGFDGTDYEIYWVKVDVSGILGTVQKVSTHPDNMTNRDYHPQIAVDSVGTSYVTWAGDDGNDLDLEIYCVNINASGAVGTVQKVSTQPGDLDFDETAYIDVAVDSSGNSYVVWAGLDGIDWEIYHIFDFSGPVPVLCSLADLFSTNSFFVVGDFAYCADILGATKIAHALGQAGTQNPEGRCVSYLRPLEHDTGNLILVGGPAINMVADEFDGYFGITYNYDPDGTPPVFEIFADGFTITLDLNNYPNEDIAIVYVGEHNNRYVLVVWGYGWQGTYAGSVFIGDLDNWEEYCGVHLLLLRWTDQNGDGLVQMGEITVEVSV